MDNTYDFARKSDRIMEIKKHGYLFIKRLFDCIFGIIGFILLIPITIIVKISYILTGDFAPIVYRQIRIGKDGKEFKLYKYRTMVPNADKKLKELLDSSLELTKEWKKNQKLEHDPRITKVGKVLRKLSIDETPQFINLLNGNMSLVGPRPLVKGELDSHNGNHKLYESVKPGITGWWACNGRSDLDYDERLNLEYYYCNNASLKLDILCILKTIQAVFFRKGAK